jgi:hypothetical protein
MMDSAAKRITGTARKKQTKPKKLAKDLISEECRAESNKCAGWRGAARARVAAAKLEEERLKANDRIIARHAEANDGCCRRK